MYRELRIRIATAAAAAARVRDLPQLLPILLMLHYQPVGAVADPLSHQIRPEDAAVLSQFLTAAMAANRGAPLSMRQLDQEAIWSWVIALLGQTAAALTHCAAGPTDSPITPPDPTMRRHRLPRCRAMATDTTTPRVLKQDSLGVVLLVTTTDGPVIRREACGCRWPGTRLLARHLLRREQRALQILRGIAGVPVLIDSTPRGSSLTRTWIDGEPLWAAPSLPEDFFELLADLVAQLHARGVCHNDLHKENNILVARDGRPALIDFQIATIHRRRGRMFAARSREDLRHVAKHRQRYERQGRIPASERPLRSPLASAWMRFGKPMWNRLRRLLGVMRNEPRRPRQGPWPVWTAPIGPNQWN